MREEPRPSAARLTDEEAERAASIHREVFQLGVLMAIAVAAIVITRVVAVNSREMNLRDADEWYRRGQQAVAAGRIDDAIDAFRRAAVRNRAHKVYVLALARALALNRDDEAARGVLTALRDTAPEDAEINLDLARLAARRDDVTEALRFYHNALYAPWPAEQVGARRDVRFELIRFLLTHDQSGRALAELLAASADLPDQPATHSEIAQLFAQAGDYDHALQHFQQTLRLSRDDGVALAGAGRSAFQLGKYALARTYLRRAPAAITGVAETREIVDLVIARDPLANRLGAAERRRRLKSDLVDTRDRLTACAAGRTPIGATAEEETLQGEADRLERDLERSPVLEQDTIESGLDLVSRVAQHVVEACGPASPLDRALVLIGREHSGDAR